MEEQNSFPSYLHSSLRDWVFGNLQTKHLIYKDMEGYVAEGVLLVDDPSEIPDNILNDQFVNEAQRSLQVEVPTRYFDEFIDIIFNDIEIGVKFFNYFLPKTSITQQQEFGRILQDANFEYKVSGVGTKQVSLIKTESVDTPDEIQNISEFISDNVAKCEERIQSKDFSGAVTSARSLLESVLKHLYKEMFTQEAHNLDLPELYKQVSKELNLHPTSSKLDEGLKKITGGLHTAVVGLSEVRNEASDAHSLKYAIEEHHAVLVVNNAKTICQFLYQSYKKQYPS